MGGGVSISSMFDGEKRRKLSFLSALKLLLPSMPKGLKESQKLDSIDTELLRQQNEEQYVHKVLLLGAGECGKSTVLKQIKLLNKVALTKKELEEFTINIRRNAIEAIQTLLLVGGELGEGLDNNELMEEVAPILELDIYDESTVLTPELATTISMIWKDEGMKRIYAMRERYHLMDATPYFLNEVERIADPEYECTEEDAIMTRVRTTGMVMTDIRETPYTYQIVDVGGQRSERRKWIHCFDNVRAIVFLEGLSGYNQVLFEDTQMNRMKESMCLFMEVVKNPAFRSTPIFIFLNKKDLFEEMIKVHPLNKCFAEYDGPLGEALPALSFIEKKYRDMYNSFHGVGLNGKLEKGKGYQPGGVFVSIIAARLRMDMKVAFAGLKDKLKQMFPIKKDAV